MASIEALTKAFKKLEGDGKETEVIFGDGV